MTQTFSLDYELSSFEEYRFASFQSIQNEHHLVFTLVVAGNPFDIICKRHFTSN